MGVSNPSQSCPRGGFAVACHTVLVSSCLERFPCPQRLTATLARAMIVFRATREGQECRIPCGDPFPRIESTVSFDATAALSVTDSRHGGHGPARSHQRLASVRLPVSAPISMVQHSRCCCERTPEPGGWAAFATTQSRTWSWHQMPLYSLQFAATVNLVGLKRHAAH